MALQQMLPLPLSRPVDVGDIVHVTRMNNGRAICRPAVVWAMHSGTEISVVVLNGALRSERMERGDVGETGTWHPKGHSEQGVEIDHGCSNC